MIVVDRRGDTQYSRHLDGEARFGIGPPKLARAGLIHHEEQGDLALLVEGLHEGMPHPRRHVPVDRAEVVPLLVLAHFGELDALAAEDRAVLDRKSTRLNSSHLVISYAVFCLKKKTKTA